MTAYALLPTGPGEQSESRRHKYGRRCPSLPVSRSKLVLFGLIAILILSTLSAVHLGIPTSWLGFGAATPAVRPPNVPEPAANPYFSTGDIWEHNDKVVARLERCEAVGLLRNTSLPNESPLSPVEEQEYLEAGCGQNQTTIIILSSIYFAEAFSGTAYATAGESIYAQSIMSALNRWGYSFMFSSLGWYNHDTAKTMEIWHKYRWNVRMVLADPEQVELCWGDHRDRCLKTDDNPEGLDAWRMLSFWYWDDGRHPLGSAFTLSPTPTNENRFLSYSIEPTCRRLPVLSPELRSKPPQAYLLAKQSHYLADEPAFSWTLPALTNIARDLDISIVGGMANDDDVTEKAIEAAGITNFGRLGKMEFYAQLATSFVVVGVGRPRISPSPWDALCMGVPFINPILSWDERNPNNRSSWKPQQWHMTDLEPPYVYHVHAHDIAALSATIQTALETPIESYIPPYMRFDYACDKVAEIVEWDWRQEGRKILEARLRSGEGEVCIFDIDSLPHIVPAPSEHLRPALPPVIAQRRIY